VSDKYAVIQAHRAQFPVRLMCRVLAVSPAGFYAARTRPPSARATADAALRPIVQRAFTRTRRAYGSKRLRRVLRTEGHRVSEKRVARLMREAGLVARPRRAFVHTTDSRHAVPPAPNRVARAFAPGGALNRVWVSDVTYVPVDGGWGSLAVVLDLASRRVLGWATSARNDTTLISTALTRALAVRRPPVDFVHHSDRGATYASAAYQALVARAGGMVSMSRAGDCWDNAVVERVFATLEHELLATARFATIGVATRALLDWIDGWYNPERLHSSLGYQSPMAYEQDLRRLTRAA
jgi:putative transposase